MVNKYDEETEAQKSKVFLPKDMKLGPGPKPSLLEPTTALSHSPLLPSPVLHSFTASACLHLLVAQISEPFCFVHCAWSRGYR